MPAGTSGWEMGAEKDPRKKADEDFAKRTKDPLGLDKKKTTFMFVTPRKWQKKGEWSPGQGMRSGYGRRSACTTPPLSENGLNNHPWLTPGWPESWGSNRLG